MFNCSLRNSWFQFKSNIKHADNLKVKRTKATKRKHIERVLRRKTIQGRIHVQNAGQLGPRTTRTETSRPVSEAKSARKRGLVGPYVKTTRTVLLFYNIVQYLCV